MAQKDERATSQTESLDNDDVLRKRLLKRVALATAVVVVLLGGLMFFDSMMVHTEKASKQIARIEPPTKPIEKQGDEGKPADEAAAKPAEIAAEPAEPAKEPIAEPERTEAPTTVSRPERPLTMPATARQAMVRSAEPAPAVQKPAAKTSALTPAGNAALQRLPTADPATNNALGPREPSAVQTCGGNSVGPPGEGRPWVQ